MSEPRRSYPKTLCQDYEARVMEDVVEHGRILKRSASRVVHPQDKFNGFSALDFALENVIAAGAVGSLRECMLSVSASGELADRMEGVVDNVIAAVDAAESNNVETSDE